MKECTKCKTVKPKAEFNKRSASLDGLQPVCSSCHKDRMRDYHSKQMDSIEGHIRSIFNRIKSKAAKENIEFDLSLDYLRSIVQNNCPILGVPLTWCKKSGKPTDNSPSVDRMFPNKGYVPGNVAWISYRANRIKSDSNLNELQKLINWMAKNGS